MNRPSVVRALVAVGLMLLAGAPALASGDDAVPRLLVELASGPGRDQDHAIERLRYLGPAVAGPPLRTLLASEDPRARIGASAALVVLKDAGCGSALEHALADPEWEVRRNAAQGLGALRRRTSANALSHVLLTDANPRVRKACALALADAGGGAAALARASARDHDLEVRLASLDALARQMDRSQAATLRPLLRDGAGLVRFAAARALAWGGDGEGRAFLEKAIASGDDEQEGRAVTVLADCPKSWAADLLAKASAMASVALPASQALARRGDRRGIRGLARLAVGNGPEAASASRRLDELGIAPAERAAVAAEKP